MHDSEKKKVNEMSTARQESRPQILNALEDEHRYFKSLLDIAAEQQALLANDAEADLDVLQELLRYLADYPEDYHHPREDLLFDRLQKIDQKAGEVIEPLLAGHEEIQKESNRLYFMVMRLNNGENINRSKLAAELGRFVTGYQKHMQEEEASVFPLALDTLSEEDWAEVDLGMEFIEDPLFGTRVRRRYRRLANYLAAKVGVAKRDLVVAEYLSLGALIDGLVTISDTTWNLGSILRDRTSQTWHDNVEATRNGFGSKSLIEFVKLPGRYSGNTLRNLRGGFQDCKNTLRQAARELREPIDMRMDYLKDMLREEWGR